MFFFSSKALCNVLIECCFELHWGLVNAGLVGRSVKSEKRGMQNQGLLTDFCGARGVDLSAVLNFYSD